MNRLSLNDWEEFECKCGGTVRLSKSRRESQHSLPMCELYEQVTRKATCTGLVVDGRRVPMSLTLSPPGSSKTTWRKTN